MRFNDLVINTYIKGASYSVNLYVLEAQILAVLVTCLRLPKLTAKLEQINLTRNAHFACPNLVY